MKSFWIVPLVALFASVAQAQDTRAQAAPKPKPAAGDAAHPSSKGPIVAATGPGLATASTAGMSQQDKMRYCAKEATGRKGDERRAFMKTCLSKKKT